MNKKDILEEDFELISLKIFYYLDIDPRELDRNQVEELMVQAFEALRKNGLIFDRRHVRTGLMKSCNQVVKYLMREDLVDVCGLELFPHNTKWSMNSRTVRTGMEGLKEVLKKGATFRNDCWKKGNPLIKKVSVECYNQFILKMLQQRHVYIRGYEGQDNDANVNNVEKEKHVLKTKENNFNNQKQQPRFYRWGPNTRQL
eukprot:UN29861